MAGEQCQADRRAAGGEATPVAVNISEPAECEKPVQTANDTYGIGTGYSQI